MLSAHQDQMGVITGNEGVLKLVFPGSYVEIHRQPITAAEVMRKNPRHCVTRQDVFQNPWIVVRPESVLHLGRVFFVLPKYTLYKLLKARGFHQHKQSSPQESQTSKEYHPLHNLHISWERESSEEQDCGRRFKTLEKLFESISLDSPQEHCSSKRFYRRSRDESLPQVITWPRNTYHAYREISQEDSVTEIRSPHDSGSSKAIRTPSTRAEEDNLAKFRPRSCLRKHESFRKLLQLRVRFA